jgi:integrase
MRTTTWARWTEFTLEGDSPRWDIPAERMKMDTPHIVPLSHQAVDSLRTMQRLTGGHEYVFAGQGKAKHMSTGTILHSLTRMGFRGKGKETIRADRWATSVRRMRAECVLLSRV